MRLARKFVSTVSLIVFLAAAGVGSSSSPAPHETVPSPVATLADKPLSERVVAYQIEARFDAVRHTVDATEILTYRNLTGQAQDTFPFHLYLNAFQPTSTFIKEGHPSHTDLEWKEKYRASEEVKSLEVVGMG